MALPGAVLATLARVLFAGLRCGMGAGAGLRRAPKKELRMALLGHEHDGATAPTKTSAPPETRSDASPDGGRSARPPIVELRDATVVYPGGHVGVERVSLDAHRGEFAFVVGPTGCGKSTLIKMLIREVEPASGEVLIAGRDIRRCRPKRFPYLRRRIGTVFQDFKLLPNRNVYDNVAYALQVIGGSRAGDPPQGSRDPAPGRAVRARSTATPTSSRAASSSGSRSRARSSTTRRCCSPTSRPGTSIPRPRSGSCSCCTGSTAPARPCSSPPTTARWSTRCAAA